MTNEQAYQKLVDSIKADKPVVVGAHHGIGRLTFAIQLALDAAQKSGAKVWLQTDNQFLTKDLKSKFPNNEIIITSKPPNHLLCGIRVIDFSIFGDCKPKLLIPYMKIVAAHYNIPTVCIVPIRKNLFGKYPKFSAFIPSSIKKHVDMGVLLYRTPVKADCDNKTFITKVKVLKKPFKNVESMFEVYLTNDGIKFPNSKADRYNKQH